MLIMLVPERRKMTQFGVSLIEFMIAITVLSILTAVAAPGFGRMIQDSQTRTIAESLQNGLRLAQGEAVKRGVQVQFFLTADPNPAINSALSTSGPNWGVVAMDLLTGTNATSFIQGANLAGNAGSVIISSGNSLVKFNSIGRVTVPAKPAIFSVTNTKGSRRYSVTVSLNGSVRMCDPDKSRSATNPDGC